MRALWLPLLLPGRSTELYSTNILYRRSVYLELEKVPPFLQLHLNPAQQNTATPVDSDRRQSATAAVWAQSGRIGRQKL